MAEQETDLATVPSILEAKLKRLAELKAAELEFAPIKQEIDQVRIDIQGIMQKVGSKRTEAAAGLFAVREERKSLTITDPDACAEWLEANTIDLMSYYKLDPGAVKALYEEHKLDTGELIPGVDETVSEVISIRTVKA